MGYLETLKQIYPAKVYSRIYLYVRKIYSVRMELSILLLTALGISFQEYDKIYKLQRKYIQLKYIAEYVRL